MSDIQDRYDELDNLISTINCLITETTSRDIIEDLKEFKLNYIEEKQNLEYKISKFERQEERDLNYEFERSRI